MVLVGHARDSLFVPYSDLRDHPVTIQFFYFITNFADEAVICFFVISGLLVGGKCVTGWARHDFAFAEYCIDRLSRLYTVLIPALVLSFALMWLQSGMHLSAECAHPDFVTLVENAAFLQNVSADLLCNNHALWSLANEFWYYALAGLVASWLVSSGFRRFWVIAIFVCIMLFLFDYDRFDNHSVILYFPIWAIGMLLWFKPSFRVPPMAAVAAFAVSLLLSRSHVLDNRLFFLRDGVIALSLAACLLGIRQRADVDADTRFLCPKTAARLANISFSVYLVHSPIIDFADAVLPGRLGISLPLSPDHLLSYEIFVGLLGVCLAAAVCTYVAFERNTRVVRVTMRTRLLPILDRAPRGTAGRRS